MGTLDYFIWNVSPEIFSFNWFSLRWYGLLFALGFLITQQILYYMYRKEGKPEADVDTLTIYMVVATILGARLGHVIFYEPQIIWEEPLSIFLPFKFNPFTFTGLQGLASHGAAIGILLALWLYSRKRKPGQSYLEILDRIVILIALTGAMIRIGNYFNSEIIGKPVDLPWAVSMVNPLTKEFEENDESKTIESIVYQRNDSLDVSTMLQAPGRKAMTAYVLFKPGTNLATANSIINNTVSVVNRGRNGIKEHFDRLAQAQIEETPSGITAKVSLIAITRHPAQLYEALSCLILFVILFAMWNRDKNNLAPGRIFAIFLLWLWPMRFVIEFFKEAQVDFEETMSFNMGQILSIPLIIAGIIILIRSYRKKGAEKSSS